MCVHYEGHEGYDNMPGTFISQEENRIDDLTVSMGRAIVKDEYEKVIELAEKIAAIYRRQGNVSEAGRLEHEAFLYTQKQIYRDACIPTNIFSDVPYVEKLKVAMTQAAEQAKSQKMIEYFVCYKRMIARICRVQGKERDAYLIECDISPELGRAKSIQKYREITDTELEEQCLNSIAKKYGTTLSKG